MKTLLMYLILPLILLVPGETHGAEKSPVTALPLLKSLRGDAIEIGRGEKSAYVFVDPKCLKSRDFLDTITANAALQKMFHYYIFLYDMPEVDSETVINAVYSAPDPKAAMFTYMLDRKRIAKTADQTPITAQNRIHRIKAAADTIGIDRTPYLIIDRQPKP